MSRTSHRRSLLERALLLPAATLTLLCVSIAPAAADGSNLIPTLPTGLGSSTNSTGLPAGVLGSNAGNDIAASGYSLTQLDALSNTMTGGVLGASMSADYATTTDLADAGLLAIDAAEMARSARLAEEARRAALAARATGGTGLRPGTVPSPYDQYILDGVARYCPQLSPSILAAQIEAESNFNPTARSSAGAQGIAQFLPSTWASYGVDGDGDGRADINNPADAIPSAARYDCVVRDAVRKVPGDPDANMLAGYNAGPGAVTRFGGIPPYTETRAYVAKILERAPFFADADGPGDAGTSAGCPTTAPAGTLRDGAAAMGITRICSESAAQAPSPAAARAIKYALRNLGAPYSQAMRMNNGYYDCSSFVMRAYQAAGSPVIASGWAPNTYAIENASFAQRISFADRKPGDLYYPFPGHIAMVLAGGLKVHTNRPGDVSHVNAGYSSAYLTVRIRT